MRQGWRGRASTGMAAGVLAAAGSALAAGGDAHPAPDWVAAMPDILVAATALVLAFAGVGLLGSALRGASTGGFWFRRHASGFGGSSTGWQMSGALVKTGCGLALVVLAASIVLARVPAKEADDAVAAHAKGGGAPAATATSATSASSAAVAASAGK